MIRGEEAGRGEPRTRGLTPIRGGGDGGERDRGSHTPTAERSPVSSRSSMRRRRYAALHVSSVLHILIIHLAFPALLSPPLGYKQPSTLPSRLCIHPSVNTFIHLFALPLVSQHPAPPLHQVLIGAPVAS